MEILENLLKAPYKQLPMVPFKTLNMIQEANGDKLIFLELFKFLRNNETFQRANEDQVDLRLIVIIEGRAYIKKRLRIFFIYYP